MSTSVEQAVQSFLASLEAGQVTVSSDGGLLFDVLGGRTVEAVFDSQDGTSADVTLWTDDDNSDPVEIATIRLTAAVIA